MNKTPKKNPKAAKSAALTRPSAADFDEVLRLIDAARGRALAAVNKELIELYWAIGAHISGKIAAQGWGKGTVAKLAEHIRRKQPDAKGFSAQNLWRMRQFYEAYRDQPKLSALLRELTWTHNLLILGKCKREEERDFYLHMTMTQRWTSRELERQINGALFERVVLSQPKLSPLVTELHPDALEVFRDTYLLDFLNLPNPHSERDLQRALVANLRQFLLELGGDFTFVGEYYRLQVGNRDFFVDLLFFHRGLQCLVAFDLKVEQFEPAHLGQLEFYLEALDRDVRKPYEKPSIGVLLCATKDEEVVEYALSRTVSPTLVAEYQTRLPDKKLLQAKLHEFYELAQAQAAERAPDTPRQGKKR